MKYLEWNNLIASYFFNLASAGKDVHLYITKKDIIKLGKTVLQDSEDDIWNDFLKKLKKGLPGSALSFDVLDNAVYCFQQWKKRPRLTSIEDVDLKFPPYIAYLAFSVLPLIEIQGDYNANNYYDRLADFLRENNIHQNLRGKLKDIDDLWGDLSNWANEIKNGELGYFKAIVFSHTTWKFVGKPFSQCVLTPKAIRKLPNFFYSSGLTPKTFYQDEIFQNHLVQKGLIILGLKQSVIDLIKKGNKDEIGQSIIETVKKEFNEWAGEENEIVLKDGIEKNIRKNTVVPLKLQFKITEDGEIDFSYRVKYSSEPPQQLKLDEFEDIYENEEWSRTLKRPFKEFFELKDTGNKWIAKFEPKSIRLFIRGGYYQLGNDFWIETESLSRVEGMYLLCKHDISNSIKEWIESCCAEFKIADRYSNLPLGYSLFWFRNPQISHESFQQLKVSTNKKILLRAGTDLKIGYRTYLNELLPEIEIANADGRELVYLQYDGSTEKINLEKHPSIGAVWLLPKNLLPNSNFSFQIEGELIDGYRQTYKIGEGSFRELSNEFLPKRNKYNIITQSESEFMQGNFICHSGSINKIVDGQAFTSNIAANIRQEIGLKFKDNSLLKWLVAVKHCGISEYNEAFETVLHNLFSGEQFRVQERRKSSIHLLDYLGYVDYNYETGKIFTLPVKLISIPSTKGKRALLIGGRDEKLINQMIEYCSDSNGKISLTFKKQSEQNRLMLIPDSIILETNSEKEFNNLAENFHIEYDQWYLLNLKSFVPSMQQYEDFILQRGSSESWEKFGLQKKVFLKDTLQFEPSVGYGKEYSLTECSPSYITEYGLWIRQSYYTVDKNWGKYLFVNRSSEKIRMMGGIYLSNPREFFISSSALYIPASLPLPKLISRLILQSSGEAPEFMELNLTGSKKRWYNVYKQGSLHLFENFFRFILEMNIDKANITS
jgi:hypothetical protein